MANDPNTGEMYLTIDGKRVYAKDVTRIRLTKPMAFNGKHYKRGDEVSAVSPIEPKDLFLPLCRGAAVLPTAPVGKGKG